MDIRIYLVFRVNIVQPLSVRDDELFHLKRNNEPGRRESVRDLHAPEVCTRNSCEVTAHQVGSHAITTVLWYTFRVQHILRESNTELAH